MSCTHTRTLLVNSQCPAAEGVEVGGGEEGVKEGGGGQGRGPGEWGGVTGIPVSPLSRSGRLTKMAAGLKQSSVPFLSVAQTFPCKLISIVYNPKLPAVNCHHSSNKQHVSCNLLIAAALQKCLAILNVILHCIALNCIAAESADT